MRSRKRFYLLSLVLMLGVASLELSGCSSSMHRLRREALSASRQPNAPLEVNARAYSAFLKATDFARQGELEEAQRWYRRTLDLDPRATTAYLRYAEVLAETHRFGDALKLTALALELEPDHYEARLLAATLHRLEGEPKRAEATLREAIRVAPEKEQAYLELATLYRVMGRPDEGLNVVSSLEAISSPLPVRALQLRASLSKDLGDLSDAEADLLHVLDENPDASSAQRALVDLYLLCGDLTIATRRLEEVYQEHPWFTWCRETLVSFYSRQGDLEAVERHLQATQETDPELAERLRLSAVEDLARRGSYDRALTALEPLIQDSAPDQYALYYAGLLYSERKEFQKALEMYSRIPLDASLHAKAVEQQAWTLFELKRMAEALSLLQSYLKTEPDADDIRYVLIGLYVEGRMNLEALKEVDILLAKNPDNTKAIIQKARLLQWCATVEEAEALLQKALRAHPKDADLYKALAALYAESGRLELAITTLKDALEFAPESVDLRFTLGSYYDALDRHDEAVAQMQRVLEVDSENADALNFIGYTWAEQRVRLAEAEVLIKRALELQPDSGYITDSLGWVYYQSGRYEEAVKVLERAVQLITAEPTIVEHLGDAYLKVGEKAKGLAAYERAAREISEERYPNDADKARILEKVRILRSELGASLPTE